MLTRQKRHYSSSTFRNSDPKTPASPRAAASCSSFPHCRYRCAGESSRLRCRSRPPQSGPRRRLFLALHTPTFAARAHAAQTRPAIDRCQCQHVCLAVRNCMQACNCARPRGAASRPGEREGSGYVPRSPSPPEKAVQSTTTTRKPTPPTSATLFQPTGISTPAPPMSEKFVARLLFYP
jgi:hypothetical protein